VQFTIEYYASRSFAYVSLLSETCAVMELVGRWNRVVVDGDGPRDSGSSEYLGLVEPFKIR
jgi:hypothetical protein